MKLTEKNNMGSNSELEYEVLQDGFLADFKCLKDKCPDTCCKGWDMVVDNTTKSLYKYIMPQLSDAIEEKDNATYIKKDEKTGNCIKLSGGICSINKQYGANVLGDACYFYPRTMQKFGEYYKASATMSCPEITRLVLFGEDPFVQVNTYVKRVPSAIRDFSGLLIEEDEIDSIHKFFRNDDISLKPRLAKLLMISRSLDSLNVAKWSTAIEHLNKIALNIAPSPEIDNFAIYKIMQSMLIVQKSTHKPISDRLKNILDKAFTELAIKIDETNLDIIFDQNHSNMNLYNKLSANFDLVNNIMKRWLNAQISAFLFPFSGIGTTILNKTKLLIFKFLINHSLLSLYLIDSKNLQEDSITAIQSIARLTDHLSDEKILLAIMDSYEWNNDAKLLGVLEVLNVK